ncbi:MAG: hypothetical protein GX864_01670 [Mollicutes bacterium]|jgi:parvulin-like peptidyl-prolyl isomerase|nr:hypothetical protein [Mollicutes bacterium]
MKKKLFILAGITLLVAGCGEVPKLKTGEDAIITFKNNVKVSNDSLYQEMKETYALGSLIDLMDKTLLEKQFKDKLESTKEEAKEESDRIKKMFGYEGKNYNQDFFLQYLRQSYGVNTVEALEKTLYLNLLRELQTKSYIESKLTDKEIKAYYETEIVGDVRVSHILVKPESTDSMTTQEKKEADEKALKDAEELIEQLKKAKDLKEEFAELAKEKSDDPGSKDLGGDLDFFNKGIMEEPFEKAAFALKDGGLTEKPVKTDQGYHIILRTESKEKASLDDSKEKIIEALVEEKKEKNSVLSIEAIIDLRKKNDMKITDSELSEQYSQYMNYLINSANERDRK